MLVQETTHHGQTYAQRTVDLPDLSASQVAAMMSDCVYPYSNPDAVERVAADLAATGNASHGWTRWEAVSDFAWCAPGHDLVPEETRSAFTTRVKTCTWVDPSGSLPAMPALGLRAAIEEFSIAPVTAVTHDLIWTNRYDVLGVRTRRQSIYFVDTGTRVVPVAIETPPTPYVTDEVPA